MENALQMIGFFVVSSAIMATGHGYIWYRMIIKTRIPSPWGRRLTALLIALWLSIPLTMVLGRIMPPNVAVVLSAGPMVWLGTMFFLVVFLLLTDIVRWVYRLQRRVRSRPEMDSNRRLFLERASLGAVGTVVSGMTGVSIVQAAGLPEVVLQKVHLYGFPERLNGFSIVQLTDIHIGLTISGDWLRRVVSRVNALKPDIVVITGDIIDGYVDNLLPEVAPLGKLQATVGVFLVTGNHEYYYDGRRWIAAFENMGIRVLQNQGVRISRVDESFWLAGVNDPQASRFYEGDGADVQQAIAGRRTGETTVLLSHQPLMADQAAAANVELMLSGHTHGGQIWPFQLFVRLQQPYVRGMHLHQGKTLVYVNPGTGLWGPPMRLGTVSEITRLELYRG